MKWEHALKDYKLYLKIERGLSANSIASYGLDVEKLMKFLEANKMPANPISITKESIQPFIYETVKHVNARSQSRIISGLRSFFNYLRSEEHTSELQSRENLVCRLLLEKKKK